MKIFDFSVLFLVSLNHNIEMTLPRTDKLLFFFLFINLLIYILHIAENCTDIFYFFQLTIIGQTLVIGNFLLSIILHERKSSRRIKRLLSRFHLMSLALEAIVVIGFWGLRIFFEKGIIDEEDKRSFYVEFLSICVHGGSFLTMFYFIKTGQIVLENNRRNKYFIHSCWGVPFLFLQYLRWSLTGEHIYNFLKEFTWVQLIIFEAFLYLLAVTIDYTLTLRHGLKLTIKAMGSKEKLLEFERKYQD